MTLAIALGGTVFATGAVVAPQVALAQGMPSAGPTEVGIVTLQSEAVPYVITLPGRAVAYEQTDIRPRVEGTVAEINYTAGQSVAVGDVLFHLDSDTYDAALSAAQADVAGAEASVTAAQAVADRYAKLANLAVTQEQIDTANVTLLQAQATLSSAQAALKTARLNVERTVITSPIAGVVEVADVSIGALVTANQTSALTTVTRMDPIYVDVAESSARLLRVRNQVETGILERGEALDIALTLESGQSYSGKGTLVSPGNTVSTTTGSVDFRLSFDNGERVIMPGMFLRVDLTLGTTQAILVPQRATSRGSDGSLTAFVVEDGKTVQVTLTSNGSYKNAWIVTDGVTEGQSLVVDGLRNMTAGTEVTTVPVVIDDQGVVSDAPSDTSADAAQTPPATE
ncbi:efflux RND transporter periplasmic adaptor subunit [Aquimixticola soesokkakensis]|uniref:efflux RND transporter periplasmic adaptor subunit n=1 Tax=Aquimixticola soesokkakensis TaxID=1519096 RepID=UPI001F182507|nr:efflux RND transporter periplasmic adaptor subunit [Aquimixticola soesokkakensis]